MAPRGVPRTGSSERERGAGPSPVRPGRETLSRPGAPAARLARRGDCERGARDRLRVFHRDQFDADPSEGGPMSAPRSFASTPAPPYYAVIFTSKRAASDDRRYDATAHR